MAVLGYLLEPGTDPWLDDYPDEHGVPRLLLDIRQIPLELYPGKFYDINDSDARLLEREYGARGLVAFEDAKFRLNVQVINAPDQKEFDGFKNQLKALILEGKIRAYERWLVHVDQMEKTRKQRYSERQQKAQQKDLQEEDRPPKLEQARTFIREQKIKNKIKQWREQLAKKDYSGVVVGEIVPTKLAQYYDVMPAPANDFGITQTGAPSGAIVEQIRI